MAERSPSRVDEPYLALTIEFLHPDFPQQILIYFLLDTHAWEKCDALVFLNHAPYRFDGWHLHVHVERDFVALEFTKHNFSIWRENIVSNKGFHIELRYRNLTASREPVSR